MSCTGGWREFWEESPKIQAGVHFTFPTRVGSFGNFPASMPPRRRPSLGHRLSNHAVHADHRARDQLERQEAPLLDPPGELDVDPQVATKAELIVVLGIAGHEYPAVAPPPGLRHRLPHSPPTLAPTS